MWCSCRLMKVGWIDRITYKESLNCVHTEDYLEHYKKKKEYDRIYPAPCGHAQQIVEGTDVGLQVY